MKALIVTLLSLVLFQSYCWAFRPHLGQVDKSNFPRVSLYVDVVDARNKPVKDLQRGVFQVFEDGTLVDLISFANPLQYRPLTTVLVLDRSGSMKEDRKIEALRAAASSYIGLMRMGDSVGVIAFADEIQKIQSLTREKRLLHGAVALLQASGGTAFYDAVYEGIQSLKDHTGRRTILALSDGMDTRSWKSMKSVTELARKYGVPVYTIGLGTGNIAETAMRSLATQTGGLYFYAPSSQDLVRMYELLSRRFQAAYELTYASPRPLEDGTTRLVTVKVHSHSTVAEAANSYYVPGVIVPSADTGLFVGMLVPLVLLVSAPTVLRRLGPIPVRKWSLSGLSRTVTALLSRTRYKTAKKKSLYLVPVTDAVPSSPCRLKQDKTLIGSDQHSRIVLPHPSVSPMHARIEWENDTYVIYDLESRAGTFVSYLGDPSELRRVSKNAVKVGSRIQLGEVVLVLSADPNKGDRHER